MELKPEKLITEMEDAAALPRENGELLFDAPWEGRAFGLAVALNHAGQYEWGEFHQRFVDEIAKAEARETASTYYERWLTSLEHLLTEKGFVTPGELAHRAAKIESSERSGDGHDHEHSP